MRTTSVVLSTLLLALSSNAYAGLFGPKDFDDCILENMKGVVNDAAASTIYAACASKFPERKKHSKDIELENPNDGICRLVINGVRTTKVEKPPRNWRDTHDGYRMGEHGIHRATIYVPKSFKLDEQSERFLSNEITTHCK